MASRSASPRAITSVGQLQRALGLGVAGLHHPVRQPARQPVRQFGAPGGGAVPARRQQRRQHHRQAQLDGHFNDAKIAIDRGKHMDQIVVGQPVVIGIDQPHLQGPPGGRVPGGSGRRRFRAPVSAGRRRAGTAWDKTGCQLAWFSFRAVSWPPAACRPACAAAAKIRQRVHVSTEKCRRSSTAGWPARLPAAPARAWRAAGRPAATAPPAAAPARYKHTTAGFC